MATPNFFYRWIFSNLISLRKIGFHKVKWYNYAGMDGRTLEIRMKYLDKTEKRFAAL